MAARKPKKKRRPGEKGKKRGCDKITVDAHTRSPRGKNKGKRVVVPKYKRCVGKR